MVTVYTHTHTHTHVMCHDGFSFKKIGSWCKYDGSFANFFFPESNTKIALIISGISESAININDIPKLSYVGYAFFCGLLKCFALW